MTTTTPSRVRQGTVSFPCGDSRTWSITVPGVNLTSGYSAVWMLGNPPDAALLGVPGGNFSSTSVSVVKTSGTTLTILAVAPDSQLRFSVTSQDTLGLDPGQYWQQAVVVDAQGNPVTVAEGLVILTPSLNALRLAPAV